MHALLYFRKLDLRSGTAQLLRMQALGLRAAGVSPKVVCERGALRFFLATGIRTERGSAAALAARPRRRGEIIVDHDLAIQAADVSFVHNVACEANRHLESQDAVRAEIERAYFAQLPPATPIVANSELVKRALTAHFALAGERIVVHRPGYQARRFAAERRQVLRAQARRALGLDDAQPLIGFVTSGAFHKRGLDVFLASAERIVTKRPDARFLVVGSRSLPPEAAAHALFVRGCASYRPKNGQPERWMAALDLFLYAARWEEFGMVVLEAAALGVPVLASRRVGAVECLPDDYLPWLIEAPDAEAFAARAVDLLADEAARQRLARSGAAHALQYTDLAYAKATARTILRTAG